MKTKNQTLEQALADLQSVAPDVPLLALGQTVFWDEPMKAGIALTSDKLGYKRKLVAGVHDTDYFAKLPGAKKSKDSFAVFPHNDSTTRGLWSAAAEFSTLFGSETVISKEMLTHYGLRIEKIAKTRPNILDEATEAWGWRGIVSTAEEAPIAANVPLKSVFHELLATLDWAIDGTLACVNEPDRLVAKERAERLRGLVCDLSDEPDLTLTEFYQKLIPYLYNFVASSKVDLESTRTSDLLRFNSRTSSQPRFDLVDLYIRPDSAPAACAAYDEAIKHSEIYGLDRFGTGAIPFDLVVPHHGRGTVRIAPKAIVIMTKEPLFISLKKPLTSVRDLAQAVEDKFGPDCVLIGKAVTLIGMLAREFVFVFHEGASSYVKYSRKLHEQLAENGFPLRMNPILRVKYNAWDSLSHCYTWLRLPEPLQHPFGTEDLCAPSFGARWREVVNEQESSLKKLASLRGPLDLIEFLKENIGSSWDCLACEYRSLHDRLEKLESSVNDLKRERIALYAKLRSLKQDRVKAEIAKGEHFRSVIFEKEPSASDLQQRGKLAAAVDAIIHQITETQHEIKLLMQKQKEFVSDPEVMRIHERRRDIELEAELKRLRLIRQAIIASKGLERASYRPGAWWFPLLCPDGGWFRHTVESAECYLEPLSA